jgi:hypothetical protein
MTSGFRDLAEFLDPDLRLPWNGKTYVIPAIPADVGLRCQALISLAGSALARDGQGEVKVSERDREVLSDLAERDLFRDVLGTVFDELTADGASWPVVKHMAITAITYFTVDEETALAVWEGQGKAPAPNRAGRRAAARTATAAANTTRKRASGNGTSSRVGKVRAVEPRSPGGTSSRTGRS